MAPKTNEVTFGLDFVGATPRQVVYEADTVVCLLPRGTFEAMDEPPHLLVTFRDIRPIERETVDAR